MLLLKCSLSDFLPTRTSVQDCVLSPVLLLKCSLSDFPSLSRTSVQDCLLSPVLLLKCSLSDTLPICASVQDYWLYLVLLPKFSVVSVTP